MPLFIIIIVIINTTTTKTVSYMKLICSRVFFSGVLSSQTPVSGSLRRGRDEVLGASLVDS